MFTFDVKKVYRLFYHDKPVESHDPVHTVEKKDVLLILPYLGSLSDNLEKSVKSIVHSAYNQVNLKVVFRTSFRIKHLFQLKDVIPKRLKSKVVYGIHCSGCEDFYVGKTKRHLITRFNEHTDFRNTSAVTRHLIDTDHVVNLDDVKILAIGNSDDENELYIKETFVIKQLKPSLNATVKSFPLEMF